MGTAPIGIFFGKRKQRTKARNATNVFQVRQLCIYIKKVFRNQNEDKAIEKQLLILKQTQSTMVYGSKFKILAYTIKWEDAAFASKFYEKLKKQSQKCDGRNGQTESLKDMINTAVKIDNRQHDRFVDKKTWSKPITKNKPQFKKDPIKFYVTQKKDFKKNCYVCGKLGHLK